MIINNLQKNRAFTLIELMVATTIFAIVMLMGVGALLSASSAAKSAHKLQVAVDNVNFAMESMTRELRTGTLYDCENPVTLTNTQAVNDCTAGGVIAFTPQKVGGIQTIDRVSYTLKNRSVNNGSNTFTLERCEYVSPTTTCTTIISPEINISLLNFFVKGSYLPAPKSPNDNIQPSVEIIMKGVVNLGNGTPFVLQSMASQRSAE